MQVAAAAAAAAAEAAAAALKLEGDAFIYYQKSAIKIKHSN